VTKWYIPAGAKGRVVWYSYLSPHDILRENLLEILLETQLENHQASPQTNQQGSRLLV
jgi:hypothetical protein